MHRCALFASLTLTALFAAPTVHAQDELVVTATRSARPTASLPSRIDVIDRNDIETRALTTLAEALGPSAVQAGGAGQQSSLFLRGANSKHTLALYDGVRLNDPATPNGVYDFGLDTLGDVDRIEVLRGPASSIYGSDAIGGVVNVIPQRGASGVFEGWAEFAAGTLRTLRASTAAAGSTETLDYGVAAEWFETDGYDLTPARMSTHAGHADGASMLTLSANARVRTGANAFDALVRTRATSAEFDTFSGGVAFDRRADDEDLENEATQTLWRVGAEHSFSEGFRLRLSGGSVDSDRNESDDGLETSAAQSRRIFAEALLQRDADAWNVNAGLSYERDSIDVAAPFSDPLDTSESQLGVFAVTQATLAPFVTLTASLRSDDYQGFGRHETYAVGAVRNLGAGRVYLSFGTAFKAPTLSERFEQSFFNLGNPDLSPERSESIEAGFDGRAMGGRMEFGASFYRTRIQDLIEYNFADRRNINVGLADIDGAELRLGAQFGRGSLSIAYDWTDARNGRTDQPLLRRPEHVWTIEAQAHPTERLQLTGAWTLVGDRYDVTYADGGQFNDANGRVSAFNVVALSAVWDVNDTAELFARVDNAAGATYEQPAAFAAPPRRATAGLRARF